MSEIDTPTRVPADARVLPSGEREFTVDVRTQDMEVNFGPQHPATHGVLRLFLTTDGEIVNSVTPYVGYLHRCAEKIAEGNTWHQYVVYTDRMDYLAAMNCNWAYCEAVEQLMRATGAELEIPEYAQYVRVIIAELQRIASHAVAVGTYAMDIGAFTPFLHLLRDREKVLDLFEWTCGARLLYNYNWIGGVSHDLPDGFARATRDLLREQVQIDGMPLHLVDTAGLRESECMVEQEGIRRAREEIQKADLVLWVYDAAEGIEQDSEDMQNLPDGIPVTRVCNKIDKLQRQDADLRRTLQGMVRHFS